MTPNETSSEIESAVFSLLREANKGGDMPSLHTSLGALGMDSLRLVEIIYMLEKQFSVVTDEELMAELKTVEDLIALITSAWDARELAVV